MSIIYTAKAAATAGREGRAETDDGKIDVDLSPPGSNGPGTNPEQLFAAGYAACFGQAVKAMARQEGIEIDANAVKITATVNLHKDEGGYSIDVTLDGEIPGADPKQAELLMQKAHEICPYSKAMRGNIKVVLKRGGESLKQAA